MTRSDSVVYLGTEFDGFLFATIGNDGNGMLLSVLSALARMDIDPWQEAAKLSSMPGKVATERLASVIAALPGGLSAHPDPGSIAARLVSLLPRRTGSVEPARAAWAGFGPLIHRRAIVFYVVLVCFVLGAHYVMTNRHLSAPVDAKEAISSGAAPARLLPSKPGR